MSAAAFWSLPKVVAAMVLLTLPIDFVLRPAFAQPQSPTTV
jgi:hypothetical protein